MGCPKAAKQLTRQKHAIQTFFLRAQNKKNAPMTKQE
jgi:hypothetical protein